MDFVAHLRKAPRQTLAELRRGAGAFPDPDTPLPLLRWIPDGADERVCTIVAILYAWHPRHRAGANLGASFRHYLALRPGERNIINPRFGGIVDSTMPEVSRHLFWGVRKLAEADIPVDWVQFYADLGEWERPDKPAQWRWAKAFWNSDEDEQTT